MSVMCGETRLPRGRHSDSSGTLAVHGSSLVFSLLTLRRSSKLRRYIARLKRSKKDTNELRIHFSFVCPEQTIFGEEMRCWEPEREQ